MILVSDVTAKAASALDANTLTAGSGDRYRFDTDYMFGINYAIDRLVEFIDRKLGSNKFSEEALSELRKAYVFQTNNYSKINIPEWVWSLSDIMPKCTIIQPSFTLSPGPAHMSFYRNDLTYLNSIYSCDRLTDDEWNLAQEDPFSPGYTKEPQRKIISYAYHEMEDINNGDYQVIRPKEIEVRPGVPNELVGIRLIKVPKQTKLITDQLEFPVSMTNLIVELCLLWIAFKQGDKTNIYGSSLQDIVTQVQNF